MMHTKFQNKKGQIMLITVMILSSMVLSASAIAGLLMFYQIRESNDAISSTKALFAADSAVEWKSCTLFEGTCGTPPEPVMGNDTSFTVEITRPSQTELLIRAQGFSGRTVRALETAFSQ